jgi:hypothetical protein
VTALAEQLVAGGRFPSVTVADAAITAGQVFRDANGQVRCAGSATPIQADQPSVAQVPALTLNPGGAAPPHKGTGNNKW